MTKTEKLFNDLKKYKDSLAEYINDENLDIIEVVPAEEFADQVIRIVQRIVIFMERRPQMKIHGVIGNVEQGRIWNAYVSNITNGFVSVSNDESTGVSRTEYKPFYKDDDEEGWFAGLKNMASMINEAWYYCET